MSYDLFPVRNMRPAAGLNGMTAIGSLLWVLLNMQLRVIKTLCGICKSFHELLLFTCATTRHRTDEKLFIAIYTNGKVLLFDYVPSRELDEVLLLHAIIVLSGFKIAHRLLQSH